MRFRFLAILVAASAMAVATGRFRGAAPADPGPAAEHAAVQEATGPSLDRGEFAGLIARISEPSGYFDTDNLISNESSYLHVLGALAEHGVGGGAYVGVGPGQNFSYIAATRPDIAFIIDIRRDNALQHLWFKALFELAPTRIEYLSLMLGRRPPEDPQEWLDDSIGRIMAAVAGQDWTRRSLDEARARVIERVNGFGVRLSVQDLATIGRIHERFTEAGFGLRFTSFGRPPRPFYPTLGGLLQETDLAGRQASYLATEERYRFVRDLERRNLVIPIVGDLAGDKALAAIGRALRERGQTVSAFYVSNIEFYLMRAGTFPRFIRNMGELPVSESSMLIRSVFGRFYAHPQNVPGYYSTQLLQSISALLGGFAAGQYRTYDDLVYGELVELVR